MSSFYSIPGAAGTIQVGTVTKLAPAATPTVTNSGTAQAAILNFGIPQGDAGLVSAANQGTAAAPGISFAADTNTGLYNPAADTIGISTNGAGRLTIDATAQPAKEVLNSVFYPLVTQADIGGAANQLSLNGMLGGMAFQSPEGIAVDRAVVQGTGVGVTSETPLLSLTGAWYSGGTSTTTKPELLIEPAGTTSTGWSTSGTGLGINAASGFAGRLIDAQVNGTSKVVVTGAGNVGIGTVTPGATLHISTNAPYVNLDDLDNAQNWQIQATTWFAIRNQTASTELVRITTAGNLGINETAPDYKLDVNGTFGFTPGASVTPVDNGDVVFELTNNTTLTIKAKGSDGVVRSVALTLA